MNRIGYLIQNCQDNVREKFQHDIDLLNENNISDYKELLSAISNTMLSIELRAIACWLTSRVGDEDSLPQLLLAVDDKSPIIRRQAIQALGELNLAFPQVLEKIKQTLFKDSDTEVREAAAYSLGLLAHRDGLTPLVNTVNNRNENPSVRGMAVEALISFQDRSTIPLLIQLLSDEAAEVRFWSAFALGQLRAKEALPELKRLVKEDQSEVSGWHKVSQEAADAIQAINKALSDTDFESD